MADMSDSQSPKPGLNDLAAGASGCSLGYSLNINANELIPLLAAEWDANSTWNAATDAQVAAHGLHGWEEAPAVQAAQNAWMRAAANLVVKIRSHVEEADPQARVKIRGKSPD